MKGSCHCGAVKLAVERRPEYLNACNCSLCVKHGVLWAYYQRADTSVMGETHGYVRADIDDPTIALHFCPRCGCATHWWRLASENDGRCGMNMRLFDVTDLRGVELRFADRRDRDGQALQAYRRPPATFDDWGA